MNKTNEAPHSMAKLLEEAVKAAIEAGNEIMKHYQTAVEVDYKSDSSPLTIADRSAHQVISKRLKPLGIPILSEEGKHQPYEERKNWPFLWIVDPLDGTKEFIKRNGEFTVNIALVKQHTPILGVVYSPPQKMLYFASTYLERSFRIVTDNLSINLTDLIGSATELPISYDGQMLTVVASKSHLNTETETYINTLKASHGGLNLVSKGSSLKFCLIAEGSADIYPRFAPTYEWDSAAAQAIIEIAGGAVISNDNNAPLRYNKENLLNPGFIAYRKYPTDY